MKMKRLIFSRKGRMDMHRKKNRARSFVTLSPECGNIELVKDLGQIPYMLWEKYGYKAIIVNNKVDLEGPNVECVKGVSLVHIPIVLGSSGLTGAIYLLFHSREIDWLSLHHAGRRSLYWSRLYKLCNPKGRVYLKLDLDFRSCDNYDNDLWERKIFAKNTKVADLVTVESIAVRDRILPYAKGPVRLLGNGYQKTEEGVDVFGERENLFLTVGRLGTQQKATEILLEAFAESAKEHDWKLKLIGSVEKGFEPIKETFFHEHPELLERVIFAGERNDRCTLYQEYCRAKVFVLPSRWESFGLVIPEALSCGCRVIVSDQVPPMEEATNKGRYGRVVPKEDKKALAEAMIQETKEIYGSGLYQEIASYAEQQFSWDRICEKLQEYMEENGL